MDKRMKHAPIRPVRVLTAFLLFSPLFLLSPPFLHSQSLASGEDELVMLARNRNTVLIADFGLGLCRQCKSQSEILDRIRAAYKDKVAVRMVQVNKEQDLTSRYQVEMIPHLVFFDPTGKVAFRKTGVMSFEEISAQLTRMGVRR